MKHLKNYITFLSRNKAYTAIELFGLSLSLMFVLLVAVYAIQENKTDRFHSKADRIYLVGSENGPKLATGIAYRLKERYPEIEAVCPVLVNSRADTPVSSGNSDMLANVMFSDSTFFSVFDFPLVSGIPSQALSARDYAVVSESFARKLFGVDNPIGKSITVMDSITVVVNAVVKELKYTCLPNADVIVRWEQAQRINYTLGLTELSNASGISLFVLAKEGSNFQEKATDIRDWFKEFFWIYKRDIWKEVRIEPITSFYLSGWGEDSSLHTGKPTLLLLLTSAGMLILLFALINYINLTVAQAGFRAKEMATRRLLGSSRAELFMRLIQEATLLTLAALLLGIVFASLAVPVANKLIDTQIDLSVLLTSAWMGSLLGLTLVVGTLAGLLPAVVISSFKPIEVVRGTFRTKSKMVFSKWFITFQHTITIALVALALLMIAQVKYQLDAPLGFNTANILVSGIMTDPSRQTAILNELRQLPEVKRIGKSRGVPLFSSNNWTMVCEGRNLSFQQFLMDRECFDILGLKFVRDNQVASNSPGVYLSEQAMQELNYAIDVPTFTPEGGNPISILGVVQNFQVWDILRDNPPIMFRFLKEEEQPWQYVIETSGAPFAAQQAINALYERITGLPYEGLYIDQKLEKIYESQIRTTKLVTLFAAIALLISLLGLVAMSTYFIQQRSKEVAIRKVFGSNNREILVKLIRTFLSYVVIAFVIATPFIYYFGREWLSGYSYRIALSPLFFIASGLFCFGVSLVAVLFQSWQAANANPVERMKQG